MCHERCQLCGSEGKRRSERQQWDSTRLCGKGDRQNRETILSKRTWHDDHSDDHDRGRRNPSVMNVKGLIQREPQSCYVKLEYPVRRRPGSQIQTLGLEAGQARNSDGITKEFFTFSEKFATDLSGCFVLSEVVAEQTSTPTLPLGTRNATINPAPHDHKQDIEDTTQESLKPRTNVMMIQ